MSEKTANYLDFDRSVASSVRAAREALGESQAALALRAGVARSTLIGIESGRGAQSGSMARVLAALGLRLVLEDERLAATRNAEGMERKLARLQAESRERDRREAHVRLAARLMANGPEARAIVKDARRMVGLWRETHSCSPAYADAWDKVLAGQPAQVGRALVSLDASWVNALLQNTPFSAALGAFQAARAA